LSQVGVNKGDFYDLTISSQQLILNGDRNRCWRCWNCHLFLVTQFIFCN